MAPKNIKAVLGDEAYKETLDYSWKMTGKMDDFAQCLGLPNHDDMLRAKNQARDRKGDDVHCQMRGILDDWFEAEESKMTPHEALDRLIAACKHDNMASKTNPLGHTLEMIKSALPATAAYHVVVSSSLSETQVKPFKTGLDVSQGTNWPRKAAEATSTPAKPSLQKGETCSRHAIGLALTDFLDGEEFDVDQNVVISSLIDIHGTDEAKNPDEFNGKNITVVNSNSGEQRRIRIDITTVVNPNDGTPFSESKKIRWIKDNRYSMVLRWKKEPEGWYHAIYAKKYKNGTFSCINSHGEGNTQLNSERVSESEPEIPDDGTEPCTRVCYVDLIRFTTINDEQLSAAMSSQSKEQLKSATSAVPVPPALSASDNEVDDLIISAISQRYGNFITRFVKHHMKKPKPTWKQYFIGDSLKCSCRGICPGHPLVKSSCLGLDTELANTLDRTFGRQYGAWAQQRANETLKAKVL